MSIKYSIYSFLVSVITVIYIFTILNSQVLASSIGNLSSITPLVIVSFLAVFSMTLSIISWRRGGNKIVLSILILLAFSPVVLLLLGYLLVGLAH